MDLKDHEEQMDSFEVKFTPKRNVLLLVLCILTWVYCLFLLVFFFGAMAFGSNKYFFQEVTKFGFSYKFYLEYLVVPILCIIGAVLMLLQHKIGFWIYLVGQLITVGFSVYSILGNMNQLSSGLFFSLLANLIPIAFTIVYATQVFKRKQKEIDMNF